MLASHLNTQQVRRKNDAYFLQSLSLLWQQMHWCTHSADGLAEHHLQRKRDFKVNEEEYS